MKTIGAARFKERCLSLLDQLDAEGLVITKRGRPVARVLPYDQEFARLIGSLRDKVVIRGDVMSMNVDWNANAES